LPLPAAAHAADCGTPYDCAVLQVGRHEFQAAIGALERLLAAEPRNLRALNLLGIALTGAGRVDDANARFRAALKLDPAFYAAEKNLAINEFNRGRLAEAERLLEQVLKRAPDDEVAHVHLAEIQFARNDRRVALQHYEKSRVLAAQNATSLLHFATCLLEEGRREQALPLLDKLPPTDAASRFQAGLSLAAAGAHAEAARFFASARKGSADPYVAGYNQTLMLIEGGDAAGAIGVAQELIQEGMKRAELYNLVSRAYLEAGRLQEAYDSLRTAARLEPKAEENYVDLARICLDHENYDLGLEIVDIGLRHRPDSWLLFLQRGVLTAMQGQLAQAEKDFESARRLAPDQPVPYAALAMAWMQTGQAAKAVEVLRERIRERPADHVVPYILALALIRSGVDPASAAAGEVLEVLRASTGANPDFAPSRMELGRILLKRDDLDGAIQELEKAVALDPQSTGSIYNLAQAYRKKGDRERAAELLSRVSKLNEQERGDDREADLKRVVMRLVRERKVSSAPPPGAPPASP
jgi:tetratricopeptide (TPR) repeat protein